jgi:hypothetical protein
VYRTLRGALIAFALVLAGMCIGGDSHAAASIVSHMFSWIFDYPVPAVIGIFCLLIGLWLGGDRAVDQLVEYERAGLRKGIEVGGDRFK